MRNVKIEEIIQTSCSYISYNFKTLKGSGNKIY